MSPLPALKFWIPYLIQVDWDTPYQIWLGPPLFCCFKPEQNIIYLKENHRGSLKERKKNIAKGKDCVFVSNMLNAATSRTYKQQIVIVNCDLIDIVFAILTMKIIPMGKSVRGAVTVAPPQSYRVKFNC